MRRNPHPCRFIRQLHHTAERPLAADPHHVVAAAFREGLRLPSNNVGVEVDGPLRVVRQVLIPNKSSSVCHDCLLGGLSTTQRSRMNREYSFSNRFVSMTEAPRTELRNLSCARASWLCQANHSALWSFPCLSSVPYPCSTFPLWKRSTALTR